MDESKGEPGWETARGRPGGDSAKAQGGYSQGDGRRPGGQAKAGWETAREWAKATRADGQASRKVRG
ncbi:hypothetical protein GCM10010404_73430 [Nonomuraea africana]